MLRRDLLRVLSATGLANLLPGALRAANRRKPNFVVFLTDDQKWNVVGYEGHPLAHTPHIDALAESGVAFRNSFVTTPICASSRATLFSSTYYAFHRFNFGTDGLDAGLIPNMFPRLLARAGYRTGLVGKLGIWFNSGVLAALGRSLGVTSEDAGLFDVYAPVEREPYISEDDNGVRRHSLDKIYRRAVRFLTDQDPEQPFCLVVAFNVPHITPEMDGQGRYQPAATEEKLFPDAEVPVSELGDPEIYENLPDILKQGIMAGDQAEKWSGNDPTNEYVNYFRLVAGADRVIGGVLDTLRATGLDEDTVVIFTSDNGLSLGDRGLSGKWAHFDESLRVPLVIRDPRNPAGSGTRPSEFALNVDIAPTILELAGLAVPESYQGASLAPFLDAAPPSDWRREFYCEHEGGFWRIPDWIGIRGHEYKFAEYSGSEQPVFFLTDLKEDPGEIRNLADDPAYGELLVSLRERAHEYQREYAQWPGN